jgi:hypothetical protein
MRILASGLLLLFLSVPASAHHSRAEFSDEVQEIEGELTQVMWFNPHAGLMVKVTDLSGQQQVWRVETFSAPRTFARFGVTADLFRPGERITVAGRASKYRENYFLGTNVLLQDGIEVLVGEEEQRWPGRRVIGSGLNVAQPVDEERLRAAATEDKGIFRVWSVPARAVTEHLPFTQEALAAKARWNPADDPVTRCEQPGMPITMKPPTPIEFVNNGDSITLRSQYFETARTIHLRGSQPSAENIPATHLGYSVGRWEGNTLVVETTRISHPYFDISGTPQSEAVAILERFTLSADQSRLDFQMTITDPATFTEPATFARYYLALGQALGTFECRVF